MTGRALAGRAGVPPSVQYVGGPLHHLDVDFPVKQVISAKCVLASGQGHLNGWSVDSKRQNHQTVCWISPLGRVKQQQAGCSPREGPK